jgi:hypothetical protein
MKHLLIILSVILYAKAEAQTGYQPLSPGTFSTISDLGTRSGVTGSTVNVAGYYSANDGGGGRFLGVYSTSLAAYPGMVIAQPVANYWWVRLFDAAQGVNVRWFGATGAGSVDDGPAFSDALNYAASNNGFSVFIPGGAFLIKELITIPTGIEIKGTGSMYSVITFSAAGKFSLKTGNHVHDLGFTGDTTITALTISQATPQNDIEIADNAFSNVKEGIYIDRAGNYTVHNVRIGHNYFSNMSAYAILALRMDSSAITDNYFTGARSAALSVGARNISIWGGSGNRIVGNNITGGVTGIDFLYWWTINSQRGAVSKNVIAHNVISNVSEESIAFDCFANSATNMNTREMDTVSSAFAATGFYHIILKDTALYDPTKRYIGSYLIGYQGKSKSCTIEILDEAPNAAGTNFTVLTTPDVFKNVSAGNVMIIGVPFLNNIISDNVIQSPDSSSISYASGIVLLGLCYGNTVTHNHIYTRGFSAGHYGISVTSLNGLDETGSITHPTGGRKAPSENNIVTDNSILGSDLYLRYYNYGNGTDYYSRGNIAANNKVDGKYVVEYNEDRSGGSNNSSANADTSAVFAPVIGKQSATINVSTKLDSTYTEIFCSPSSAETLSLPALANAATAMSGTTTRTAYYSIRNMSPVASVTIDANGSETINGALTLVIPPNSLCELYGFPSGWLGYTSSSFGGSSPGGPMGNDFTAQTANKIIATYTVGPANGTFRIEGYTNIDSISVDVIQLQAVYTDENGTVRTVVFYNMGSSIAGLSMKGNSFYPALGNIRCKAGTTITLSTFLTTTGGSILYDTGGTITPVR